MAPDSVTCECTHRRRQMHQHGPSRHRLLPGMQQRPARPPQL